MTIFEQPLSLFRSRCGLNHHHGDFIAIEAAVLVVEGTEAALEIRLA